MIGLGGDLHTYVVSAAGEGMAVHNCGRRRIDGRHWLDRKVQNSKWFGSESKLFGNTFSGRPGRREGLLNKQSRKVKTG